MLLVISGFPAAFLHAFFAGSLLIEQVFTLDGLGYLSYKSALDRDYAVLFGSLYIFTIIGLIVALLSDITYMLVDPRIDFEARDF
jgi:microcin C transport system permease protein